LDAYIRQRLAELRRKILQLELLTNLWQVAGALAAVTILLCILEAILHLPPSGRLILFWMLCAATVLLAFIRLALPYLRHIAKPIPDEELALRWGRVQMGVNDRLLNAMQVFENREKDRTSQELAELALKTISEEIRETSYDSVLDRRPLQQHRKNVYWMAGVWVVAWILTQGALSSAFLRILQPRADFRPKPPFELTFEHLPGIAIRGEPLTLTVRGIIHEGIHLPLPKRISLYIVETGADPANPSVDLDSTGRAHYTVENPQNDLKICAYTHWTQSDTVIIPVKTRPFIKNLEVRWFPPAYSGLPSGAAQDKRGDVAALYGSRVSIAVEADRNLAAADLVIFPDAQPETPAKISIPVQKNRAATEFVLKESGHYNILLRDQDGITNAAPVDYNLWPIPDETPTVDILYPPTDAELNESMLIPIKGKAKDDFSIVRMRLGYRILKAGRNDSTRAEESFVWDKIPYDALGDGNFMAEHLWDLTALNLLPGDVIQYRLEAMDNDAVSGPKIAFSAVQRLIFPTMEEIFARMEEGQSEQMTDVQETLDQSKTLKKELDALREELKRNPDLSWEDRKKVEEMVKRQEEMAKRIEQMSEQAEQLVRQMEENNLLSTETLQKYQELQKLISEVMTPELMQAMQKLQEALQKQDPEELRRAVEQFSLNQEQFLEQMEKTLNILKQLQMEMKLDELAKRAEKLLEKQQDVNQNLSDSEREEARPQEAGAEAELQREMQAFEREFQKTQEMLKDSPYNPEESLREAQQLLDENQFPQEIGQMSQELQTGEIKSARQKGAKIQSGLAQLSQKMKQAKQQMTDASKNDLADALKKIAHDLLELSFQEEDLLKSSAGMDKASPRFRSLAEEQQLIKNQLERTAEELFKLSQKSFFITPQIGFALKQAFQGMDQALGGYTARNPQSVTRQQQTAMGGLNRAVMEIGNSLEQLSQSSSSTGFSEMMEQLAKMAGEQGQINQGTMALIPGGTNPGGLTLEQQAAMSRLAAQQEALRQQLEQLNQSSQQTQQLLGRLGELGKEMQEIVNDLKNQQVDERTLKRQEKILTRLLDAQRSVREREYRRERISRTAEGVYPHQAPGVVDENAATDETRELLLRALKEGYTRDYQQLIREYFEALAREK
jgi:hypothetical protein